jgi:type III restriction/modification enzyme restriction subunit/XPB helicase-like protein
MVLASGLRVRLTFDRGTVVLTDEGDKVDLAALPGVLWDARVGAHRVSPHRCAALLAELRTRGVRVTDQAASSVRRPDVVFSCPALRDYQRSALETWEARGRRGIVVLPTGSGKTCVALGAIARAHVPTLCIVPTRVLLHQWRAMLAPHGKRPIGILGDGQHTIEAVTVATFESAFRMMERIGDRFGLLIIDEAHHFGNGVRDEALEMCAAPARLGLTATPNQNETGARVTELIGPIGSAFRILREGFYRRTTSCRSRWSWISTSAPRTKRRSPCFVPFIEPSLVAIRGHRGASLCAERPRPTTGDVRSLRGDAPRPFWRFHPANGAPSRGSSNAIATPVS